MSEVIVRMEMPKHGCCDCMVELMGLCVIQDKDVPLKNENGDYPTELPKGCPIIGELPEHGDLIDRDRFKENLDMVCDAGGWLEPITQAVRVYCKKQVDAEKTIVPATERSET